jgi:predicted MPP superfamily phosphohydrolase
MKRIVWSTDVHLNFVGREAFEQYVERLIDSSPDVILLGGDIADSKSVVDYLSELDNRLPCPIYFVLGNHDYYLGSIAQVREQVEQLCAARETLVYLTGAQHIEISAEVGLVGHDGWADARIGDYERSMVMMNDYRLIAEFEGLGKEQRWRLLKSMGDEAATAVRRRLSRAMERYRHVFFLTHVPPLRAACWYNGRISDDEWAPHFTCKAMGDVLLEVARSNTPSELTVLCGHTHSPGECQPLPNVKIITGGAEYGFPGINHVFHV